MILEKLGTLGLIAKVTGVVAFLAPAISLSPVAASARTLPSVDVGDGRGPLPAHAILGAGEVQPAAADAYDSDDAVMGDARAAAERICALHTVADMEIAAIQASMSQLRADIAAVAVDR